MDNQNQEVPQVTSNHEWLKTLGIGFGIVSFGIAIGVIGYIMGTKNSQTVVENQQSANIPTLSQPSPTPVDEAANWKTYTNTKYKYSIKYPSNWGQLHDNNAIYPVKGEADSESPYITVYKKDSLEIDSNNAEGISIWVLPYTSKDFNESIERHKGNKIAYSKFIKESKQIINGIDMILIETDVAGDDKIKPNSSRNYFFLTPDGKHYINIWVRDNSQQANKKIFDQILSTFQFTN